MKLKILLLVLFMILTASIIQPQLLYCGNGVCDPGEDPCNCPEDCGAGYCAYTNCGGTDPNGKNILPCCCDGTVCVDDQCWCWTGSYDTGCFTTWKECRCDPDHTLKDSNTCDKDCDASLECDGEDKSTDPDLNDFCGDLNQNTCGDSVGEECLWYDDFCDGLCAYIYQEHDPDLDQSYCNDNYCDPQGLDSTVEWGINTGDWTDNCCGDDTGEYVRVNNWDTNDRACCDDKNDCVYNGNCYPHGTDNVDVDGDGDNDYCWYGGWHDCASDEQCLCHQYCDTGTGECEELYKRLTEGCDYVDFCDENNYYCYTTNFCDQNYCGDYDITRDIADCTDGIDNDNDGLIDEIGYKEAGICLCHYVITC